MRRRLACGKSGPQSYEARRMRQKFKFPSTLELLTQLKSANRPGLSARFLRDEVGSYVLFMALLLPFLVGLAGLGTEAGF